MCLQFSDWEQVAVERGAGGVTGREYLRPQCKNLLKALTDVPISKLTKTIYTAFPKMNTRGCCLEVWPSPYLQYICWCSCSTLAFSSWWRSCCPCHTARWRRNLCRNSVWSWRCSPASMRSLLSSLMKTEWPSARQMVHTHKHCFLHNQAQLIECLVVLLFGRFIHLLKMASGRKLFFLLLFFKAYRIKLWMEI